MSKPAHEPEELAEIRRAAATGIYDIRGGGSATRGHASRYIHPQPGVYAASQRGARLYENPTSF